MIKQKRLYGQGSLFLMMSIRGDVMSLLCLRLLRMWFIAKKSCDVIHGRGAFRI